MELVRIVVVFIKVWFVKIVDRAISILFLLINKEITGGIVMGVYHFMGVGFGVGAVTCAVDYIEKALDLIADNKANDEILKLFHASGGINHSEKDKGKVEAVVLFTSKEVIGGSRNAFPYRGCAKPGPACDEILRNLDKVWKRAPHVGRKVFLCEVNIDDFQDCFDKIIKVAYRFSPSGRQGKEIWCNLTGGTNAIGFALLSMARLTGLSTKHYLISQSMDYREEVRVPQSIRIQPNKDNYFQVVPFLRTRADTIEFYEILMRLERIEKPVTSEELLGRLRELKQFSTQTFTAEKFRRDYMLKLFGLGYTNYDVETDLVSISEVGKAFLEELEEFETFIALGVENDGRGPDIVEESKTWDWFTEVKL